MSQPTTPDVSELFQQAYDEGDLTAASLKVVQNLGPVFAAALGTPASQVTASEVTLFAELVDNSGSLGPLVDEVIQGQHECIDALLASKQANSILMLTRYYTEVLHPFVLLPNAVRMDRNNYPIKGATPLYDGSLELLATVTAKAQEFASNGVPVRTVSLIVTDGANNASRHTAKDVKTVVDDLLRAETHIVAGMGIDDGYTDYKAVFKEMGIQDQWILTPGKDASSIRRAFQMVSQSAVRASQSGASFSQTALQGFVNP